MSTTHRKQYHQLMSGCGFTGPHRIRTAPTMEYWSGNADAVEEFDAIRFRNQIPFNTMVYRHGGELCVGVFTDMPNPDFRCSDSPLLAAAPELLAMLEAIRTAYDNAASHGHAIPSELVRAIGESAAITAKAKGWATT